MKNTCKYQLLIALLLLAHISIAKDGVKPLPPPTTQIIHNAGQIIDQHSKPRSDIDFKISNGGVTMFGGNGQLHYQWTKSVDSTQLAVDNKQSAIDGNNKVSIYRMDVTLVGANKNAQVVFEEPTGYYESYYLAHTGENGAVAKGYSRVTYRNVYQGIDWVIYTPPAAMKGSDGSQGVKYDFIIHPGGNPADIRLRYDGATELKLVDGALMAVTPYGTITEDVPYSYDAETKTEVVSKYLLTGNELRFDIGQYEGTLVIDPTLVWSTYMGGSSVDVGYTVTSDTAGNIILAGIAISSSNIATTGTHQTTNSNGADCFVSKYNVNGALLWGTYYGGNLYEEIQNVTCDDAGNIYVCGQSRSNIGIATTGAHQDTATVHSGFLAKFNSAGIRQWGTYYPVQKVLDVKYCRISNSIYIGGEALMNNAIATSGSHQPSYSTGVTNTNEGFIVKFNPNGVRQWGTFYGGIVLAIATDLQGNIYACGAADTNNIASTGAYQSSIGSNEKNGGYLVKFNSNGVRQWGTYYLGIRRLTIRDIATDQQGNIYLCGETDSNNNIATSGAFKTTTSTASLSFLGGDGFVTKFNSSGNLQWCTYYGGTNGAPLNSICTGPAGEVYAKGFTMSTNNIATAGSYQTSLNGTSDAYIVNLSPTGKRLWASYYGGNSVEDFSFAQYSSTNYTGIAYNKKGRIDFCGVTRSATGIAFNANQSNIGGGDDAYLAQFEITDTAVYTNLTNADSILCKGDSLYIPYGVTKNFNSNNTFTVQLSNAAGSFASPVNLRVINNNTGGIAGCIIPGSVPDGTGYRIRIVTTSPIDTSEDNGFNIKLYSYPANFTASSNSPACTGKQLQLNSGTTTTGVTYVWSGPNGFSSAAEDPVINNATLAAAGNYYITISNNRCAVKDTVAVVVNQTPENVIAGSNGQLCTGDTLRLTSSSTTAGVSYAWAGPNNYNTQNVTIPSVQLSHAGTYVVTVTLGSCSDTESITVMVDQSATVNVVPLTPTTLCVGDNAQFASFITNAGTNPQLQWQINSIDVPGANAVNFSTLLLSNGDKVRLEVSPNTTCPGVKLSNEITMTVLPVLAPSVTIAANPTAPWNDNVLVTFTATPTNGGAVPQYQWRRNGAHINGATSSTWGIQANQLSNNDNICVVLKSGYECPQSDTALSNCISVAFTGVRDVVNKENIQIYPNPTNSVVTITATTTIEKVAISNLIGQTLLLQEGNSKTMSINLEKFAAGVYVLKVNDNYVVRVVKE